MKCFYHNDADGHCAAFWVYYLAIADEPSDYDTMFVEMTYEKTFPIDIVRKDEQIFIVDFSISPDEMRELLKVTKNVTWIDHHISAIGKYKDFEHDIRGIRYDGIAGCMLTYCYLNHMTKYGVGEIKPFDISMTYDVPLFTKLIADWDVWDFKYGNDTRYFVTAFNAESTQPFEEFWEGLIWDMNFKKVSVVNKMIEDGKIMIKYRDGYMKDYTKLGFEVNFEGYRCFAMNIGNANSEFFKSIDDGSYDILMPFVFNGEKWRVSMYSKGKVDVSKIAEKYGGGGHKNASGFVCEKLPFKKKILF